MARYLVFAGDHYYPGGGWTDFVGSAVDLTGALKLVANHSHDWWHIVDTEVMLIVEHGEVA